MTWLRIDDGFPQHPKVVLLTISERWAWLEILTYCARYRTAGHVTRGVRSAVAAATPKLLAKLVDVRLLDDAEDGWNVHDWDDYNPKDPTAAERARRYRSRDADRDGTVTVPVTEERDATVTDTVTQTVPRARASARVPVPIPSPNGSLSSTEVLGADDERIIKELVALARDDAQERAWVASYKYDRDTMIKRLVSAKQNATTNVGGYLDSMIRSGTIPDVEVRTAGERIHTACLNWINSPAYDPATMGVDQVREEFERKERKIGGELTHKQRADLLALAMQKTTA